MRRRGAVLFMMLVAGVPLVVASTAWACANLAAMRLDTRVAKPGQEVTGVARNFSGNFAGNGSFGGQKASEITIRLGGRKGPIVQTVPAPQGRRGAVNVKFTVPADAKPGPSIVLATQTQTNSGSDETVAATGSPARHPLRITGAAASRSSAAPSPWSSPTGGSGGSAGDGFGGSTTALGLLSLALLAGGVTLFGRSRLTTSYRPRSA